MFVRSLRLAGFKSFATPTILEFEPGVNVIVGPNGSGKSNIADALSWVLGSQAPSTLRGASMEDVIFAGSATRPRLGMAEVSVTLDNSSGALGLEVSEMNIARMTDRAGASEYRINGAPCRLLDIQELLSDTGIGRSLHTVVGQGQLDAVLQARPEDRRGFIEEAAQIGKYRRRKDRALRKLERVDDNLLRLTDVLSELKRAIRPLKRQATAAAAHSELLTEHRDLRQRLTATELKRLTDETHKLDIAEVAHQNALLSDELSSLRARLAGAVEESERLVVAADEARDTATSIERTAERLLGLGKIAAARAAAVGARLEVETAEGYRERIRLLDTERVRFSTEVVRLRAAAEESADRAASARAVAEEAAARREEAEQALAWARREETGAAQALVRAEGAATAGTTTIEALQARVEAAVERRALTDRELAAEDARLADAEREVLQIEQDLDRHTEEAAAAETRLDELRSRAEEARRELSAVAEVRAGAAARVAALEEVTGLFLERSDVVALIAPLLEESRGVHRAAEAKEAAARAGTEKADEAVETQWLVVAERDEELRRLDAVMAGAAERLAGLRRRHESRRVELATLDDELARVKDALADAERRATEERAALPARRAAVEEAAARLREAESILAESRRAFGAADRTAVELEMAARSDNERALAAQLRLEEAEAGIADAERALEGLEQLRTRLTATRARAMRISQASGRGAEIGKRWGIEATLRAEEALARARSSAAKLDEMRARERDLTQRIEVLATRRNAAEVRRAEAQARIDALAERALDEWGLSLDKLLALEGFSDEDEAAAGARAEELDRQMRRLGPINPRAHEEYAELAERESFLGEQMEDLRASKRDLMKVVTEVDETIVEVFAAAFEEVAREFEAVFTRLFPGGEGRLELTDAHDLLSSGIEIEARPPGKNVKKLSLLSGGERSLVALGFLFAIFRARPSPFYLLDEVEAALDDINLQRFLGLVKELEERAQVLIVTHQKRTMEAADVLYGVSMAKDGVSTVVAKRLEDVALAAS